MFNCLYSITNSMKLLPIISALIIISCTSKKETQAESTYSSSETADLQETKTDEKSMTIDYQVTLDFMYSYIANWNKMENALGMIEWTKATPFATEKFKKDLIKMVKDAD